MNTILHKITLAISFILALSACSTSENAYYPDEPDPGKDPEPQKKYTVLVYMVANNNLGTRDLDTDDINEMKQGILAADLSGGSRLLVYHASAYSNPNLIEITSQGTDSVLVAYDSSQPSVSIARMKQVIADAKQAAPASDYGLVLWSHGTGWLEDTGTYNDPDLVKPAIAPLSFGADGSKKMSVPALAQGIGNNTFSFVYFDCCLMGTVEVLYELGSAAPLISASATELPLEGMPYNETVPFLLKGDVNSAAEATYHFYSSGQGSESSCAIGVYDMTHLPELASAMRTVMEAGATYESGYAPVPFFRTSVVSNGAYDMADYVRALQLDNSVLQAFNDAYGKLVTNTYATPRSYGLNMARFTGLGCNIVRSADDSRLDFGYRNLKWFNDVVSHSPIFTQQ